MSADAHGHAPSGGGGKAVWIGIGVVILLMLNVIGMFTNQFGGFLSMLKMNAGVVLAGLAAFLAYRAMKKD